MFSDGPGGIINTNEQNLSEIDYRLNNTWYSYYRINIYIPYFQVHYSAKNSIKLYIFGYWCQKQINTINVHGATLFWT